MPHRVNRTYVSNADALTAWMPAARELLLETAQTYNATVTYADLATQVQEVSGITTDQLMTHWIGKLLERVAADAHRRDDPPLAALCLNQDGSIGEGYRATHAAAVEPEDADLDALAAEHRLLCYRKYATDLPADGGVAFVPPRAAARPPARARTSSAPAPRVVAPSLREVTCTNCFMIVAVRPTCSSCGAPLSA